MRLTRFRVQNYKIVDDTGEIDLDTRVTALVGRNESGKTAILRALWKSRNLSGATFDKQLDYPRARYARERRGSQHCTILDYALAPEEATDLAALFPFQVEALPAKVTLRTWYAGEEQTGSGVVFERHIETRGQAHTPDARGVVAEVSQRLARHTQPGDRTIADAAQRAQAELDRGQPLWQESTRQALSALKETIEGWSRASGERASAGRAERQRLDELVSEAERGDPLSRARSWVLERIPPFIYFDDYGQLETRIHLPTYLKQSLEKPLAPRVRTQRALFRWSGLDPEEILRLGRGQQPEESHDDVQRRLDKRRALLESASFHLTGDWVDWWMPDCRHQLHLTTDREYLVLNVSDSQNPFQVPFEERSHGFQWFFSFYLVFLVESEDAHQNAILLLDEPGLHLHPTMQARLIAFFERVADSNQILYSTHLPFLVDGEHLDRVRTVHMSRATPPRTVVSTDVLTPADRDTMFPLQAAVAYSMAQSMFLGQRPVVVEDLGHYLLLKALDHCLGALGRPSRVHREVVFVPAGGARGLLPLAALTYSSTRNGNDGMLVLLDSSPSGRETARRLERDLFRGDPGVLMIGNAIGLPDASIEDLLPRADYAAAVSAALNSKVDLDAAEMAAPTNVAAVELHGRRMGWSGFGPQERTATLLWLVEAWTADPKRVPDETLRRVTALFDAINPHFEG